MTNKKTRDEEVAHARRYMAMPLTKAAMDRARGHWVPWLIEALDEAEAEQVRMRDVLLRNNFAPCDTQACNCGGWHERATGDGFYARFREIEEAIGDHNGKTLLAAVVEMVQERDSLQTEVDGTIQSRAESLAWDALGRPDGTHDTINVQRLCEAHGALKAKLAALVAALESNHVVMHHRNDCSVPQMMSNVPCHCEVGKLKEALAAAKVQP